MSFHVAQVNIARLLAPIDSDQLADFVAQLDPVNASADQADGFVWRLQTDEGNATAVQVFEWDVDHSAGVIVNMSVWESVEDRVRHLRRRGPTPQAFTLRQRHPGPDDLDQSVATGPR